LYAVFVRFSCKSAVHGLRFEPSQGHIVLPTVVTGTDKRLQESRNGTGD
jgi:hypothetical protein